MRIRLDELRLAAREYREAVEAADRAARRGTVEQELRAAARIDAALSAVTEIATAAKRRHLQTF